MQVFRSEGCTFDPHFLRFPYQGETPLDIAKTKKNVWISSRLQMQRREKGLDAGDSFIQRTISSKKVTTLQEAVQCSIAQIITRKMREIRVIYV